MELAKKDAAAVDPQIRNDVLAFFQDLTLPFAGKATSSVWKATLAALDQLKAQQALPAGAEDRP